MKRSLAWSLALGALLVGAAVSAIWAWDAERAPLPAPEAAEEQRAARPDEQPASSVPRTSAGAMVSTLPPCPDGRSEWERRHVLHRVEAVYPESLKAAGVEGRAVVRVLVPAGGGVPRDVQVVRADRPAFARAAEAAVRQWRYKGFLSSDQMVCGTGVPDSVLRLPSPPPHPVAAWTTTVVRFRLAQASREREVQDSMACELGCAGNPSAGLVHALERMPERKCGLEPVYPDILKHAGTEGRVVVRVRIGPDGAVKDAEALRSDHPGLNAPALEAVRSWQFDMPPCWCGARWMTIPVRFRL